MSIALNNEALNGARNDDVEASEDLENWSVVDTVVNETGESVFQDSEPPEQTCRFCRFVAKGKAAVSAP